MKVLNVASPSPIPKNPNSKKPLNPSHFFLRQFNKTLISLTPSLYIPPSAKSLTYDEALGFPNPAAGTPFDPAPFVDSAVKFGSENPLIVAGGVAAVLIPVVVSQAFSRPKNWGVESAKIAYEKLGIDESSQLIDVREGKELRAAGSPDLGGLKKKVVRIGYGGEDKAGFLKKVASKFRDPGDVTLFVIDK